MHRRSGFAAQAAKRCRFVAPLTHAAAASTGAVVTAKEVAACSSSSYAPAVASVPMLAPALASPGSRVVTGLFARTPATLQAKRGGSRFADDDEDAEGAFGGAEEEQGSGAPHDDGIMSAVDVEAAVGEGFAATQPNAAGTGTSAAVAPASGAVEVGAAAGTSTSIVSPFFETVAPVPASPQTTTKSAVPAPAAPVMTPAPAAASAPRPQPAIRGSERPAREPDGSAGFTRLKDTLRERQQQRQPGEAASISASGPAALLLEDLMRACDEAQLVAGRAASLAALGDDAAAAADDAASSTASLLVTSMVSPLTDAVAALSASTSLAAGSGEQYLPAVAAAIKVFAESVPGLSGAELSDALAACKDPEELRRVVNESILPHPLMNDVLNGHGFRVFAFSKASAACARIGDVGLWVRLMRLVRPLGFRLTRNFVAAALDALRRETARRFNATGRNMMIARDVLSHAAELREMAAEDGVQYDWVLMTRHLFVVTNVVAIFDRQNLYRTAWPASGEVPRREGIISEWVVCNERPTDYDTVCDMATKDVAQLLQDVQRRIGTRPPFSFVQRLADFYFATDAVDAMIATLEDAQAMGVQIGESSTAKLMQLACAFNHPEVPRLFYQFRATPPQCVIAAPDAYRLLSWYSRSGGGRACPRCGDPWNHRNPVADRAKAGATSGANAGAGVKSTPMFLRAPTNAAPTGPCPLFVMAQTAKGELENNPEVPQCRDWSLEAQAVLELCEARAIVWSAAEWRAYLQCFMFAPRAAALEACELALERLPRRAWDDFLAATVVRLLRHHDPARCTPLVQQWRRQGFKMSPLVVQEAMLGAVRVTSAATSTTTAASAVGFQPCAMRVEHLRWLEGVARDNAVYTMPYTRRALVAEMERHARRGTPALAAVRPSHARDGVAATVQAELLALGVAADEAALIHSICAIAPHAVSLLDAKDSCADIRPTGSLRSTVHTHRMRHRGATARLGDQRPRK